jgi:cyclophilin family peptidyl-prolyl cis-trans isomerase
VLAQIAEEFPDDVRLVYRHFPLIEIHDKAQLAAEAAEAAGAQARFWEMHDLLFANQAAWANLPLADFRALLDTYAAQLGLDAGQFVADLDGGKFTGRVQAAYDAAIRIPIPHTPFILFNGEVYRGPMAHWALVTLIRLELLKDRQYSQAPPDIIDPFLRYTATLHTAKGDVVIELFAEQAPLTVNSFVFLAREGWYDGVTFHMVVPEYALTGDPSHTGYGGPGYFIPNEINPDLKFDAEGWVGMANAGPDTNGSQFFITLTAMPNLDGQHTLFGRVVRGMEVLRALAPRDPSVNPEAPPGDAILSVTIEEQ